VIEEISFEQNERGKSTNHVRNTSVNNYKSQNKYESIKARVDSNLNNGDGVVRNIKTSSLMM
jgi:hypothetical protein